MSNEGDGSVNEQFVRGLAAEAMAQGFLVDLLLARYFQSHPQTDWQRIADELIAAGTRTDQLTGVASDDGEAEFVSDVVLMMHDCLERHVRGALSRAEAGAGQKR